MGPLLCELAQGTQSCNLWPTSASWNSEGKAAGAGWAAQLEGTSQDNKLHVAGGRSATYFLAQALPGPWEDTLVSNSPSKLDARLGRALMCQAPGRWPNVPHGSLGAWGSGPCPSSSTNTSEVRGRVVREEDVGLWSDAPACPVRGVSQVPHLYLCLWGSTAGGVTAGDGCLRSQEDPASG